MLGELLEHEVVSFEGDFILGDDGQGLGVEQPDAAQAGDDGPGRVGVALHFLDQRTAGNVKFGFAQHFAGCGVDQAEVGRRFGVLRSGVLGELLQPAGTFGEEDVPGGRGGGEFGFDRFGGDIVEGVFELRRIVLDGATCQRLAVLGVQRREFVALPGQCRKRRRSIGPPAAGALR